MIIIMGEWGMEYMKNFLYCGFIIPVNLKLFKIRMFIKKAVICLFR